MCVCGGGGLCRLWGKKKKKEKKKRGATRHKIKYCEMFTVFLNIRTLSAVNVQGSRTRPRYRR